MIGDTTNFASRLESLNKYLGTQILISEAVKSQLGGKFVTRPLGEFRLAGKTQSVVIHELICRAEEEQGEAVWIEVFEQALDSFRGAEFEQARLLMQRAMKARGGADGPAEFYLRKIDTVETSEQLENWTGVVSFTEK
jgi:adenylate cyclase